MYRIVMVSKLDEEIMNSEKMRKRQDKMSEAKLHVNKLKEKRNWNVLVVCELQTPLELPGQKFIYFFHILVAVLTATLRNL